MLEEKTQERRARGRKRGEPASGETESGEPRKEIRGKKRAWRQLGRLGAGEEKGIAGEGSRSRSLGERAEGTQREIWKQGCGRESRVRRVQRGNCVSSRKESKENSILLASADAPFLPLGGLCVRSAWAERRRWW